MIIQFTNIDYQDIELARLSAWLMGGSTESILYDIAERSRLCGVAEDVLRNNTKIQELLQNRNGQASAGNIRTPLSDWYEIPFLIDCDEKPVTVANAWLRHISQRGSPKTWRTYAYALFDFFQYLEANNIDWREVDDRTLLYYRLHQETTDSSHKKEKKGTRRIAKTTIQMRILIAYRFYKFAASNGYIEKTPLTSTVVQSRPPTDADFLAHLNRPRQREISVVAYERLSKNQDIKWLPHEEVWAWISSIKNERDKLMAKLLYQTGMRREEIILWKVGDIPEINNLFSDPSRNWVSFPIRGKGGKTRLIRISVKNYSQLRHWIDFDRERILKRYGIKKEHDHRFVWVSAKDGHPLKPISLNHIFQEISESCGIYITPHMLRHSFAVEKRMQMYKDRVPNPEKVLQLLLGHSSVVTTISIYGDLSPECEAEEAESNAELINKLIPE